ncbi:unnamed protein product [Paramecium primaurelia]|uniref:Uncharacterized protein n=1 Tax=Paramecium primaurelia TaxID=5886 RepID=A0A8S1KDR7_PARPR|nr:unnamed protein product [Paramecium primaurelia]CAD8053861.1 unnamed protein product [Paramecium primaurelia]
MVKHKIFILKLNILCNQVIYFGEIKSISRSPGSHWDGENLIFLFLSFSDLVTSMKDLSQKDRQLVEQEIGCKGFQFLFLNISYRSCQLDIQSPVWLYKIYWVTARGLQMIWRDFFDPHKYKICNNQSRQKQL